MNDITLIRDRAFLNKVVNEILWGIIFLELILLLFLISIAL